MDEVMVWPVVVDCGLVLKVAGVVDLCLLGKTIQGGTALARKERGFPVFVMTGMVRRLMMMRKVEAGGEYFIFQKLYLECDVASSHHSVNVAS